MEGDKPKPDGDHIRKAGSTSVARKLAVSGFFGQGFN